MSHQDLSQPLLLTSQALHFLPPAKGTQVVTPATDVRRQVTFGIPSSVDAKKISDYALPDTATSQYALLTSKIITVTAGDMLSSRQCLVTPQMDRLFLVALITNRP